MSAIFYCLYFNSKVKKNWVHDHNFALALFQQYSNQANQDKMVSISFKCILKEK